MKKISTLLAALTCFLVSAFAQSPVAGFTNSPNGICLFAGDTIFFTNASSGYTAILWNFDDAGSQHNTSTEINPFHIFSSGGTFTVTLVVYNGALSDTAFEEITVLPALAVTPKVSSICSGSSQTLTASGGTYQWFNDSNNPSVTVTPLSTTTYTVTITSSVNVSCTQQVAAVVYVNSTLAPVITPANATVCLGDSITLTVTQGTTYSWSGSGGVTQSITVAPIGIGSYSVVVYDTTGCVGTATATVSVATAPTVSVSPSSYTTCSGSSVIITANAGTSGITYAWSNGSQAQAINVAPATTTPYTVTAQNTSGCTATVMSNVTIRPTPAASAGDGKTLATCSSSGVIIGGSPTASGGTPPYGYLWSPGTWLSARNVSNPTVEGITSPITYTVVVTDNNGCSASDTVTVNVVTDNVSVSVSPTNSEWCANSGTGKTLTATVTGGDGSFTYSWSGGTVTPANEVSGVVDPEAPGHYIYKILVADGYNCTATASSSVLVDSLPRASAGPEAGFVICGDTMITIGGDPTAVGGSPPYQYVWSNTDAVANPVVSPTVTTNYSVTVEDSRLCSSIAAVIVKVDHASASVSATAGALCPGGTDTLTASGGGSYLWSDGTTGNTLVAIADGDSTYSVTVTDGSNCTATAGASLNALPVPPQPDSISYPRTVCFYSDYVTFVIDTPNSLCSYAWSITPTELWRPLSPDSAQYSFSQAGFHTITLTIGWSENSCTTNFTDTFTVPAAIAPNSLSIVLTQPGNSLFCLNDSLTSYQWGFDNLGVSTPVDSANGPLFSPLNFDTVDNAYWLDVCSGGCCTRIYYNNPPLLTLTAINDLSNAHLKVFPNPTSGHITVSADANMRQFEVFDLAGRHVAAKEVYGSVTEFDLGPYQGGIYIGQVTFENGVVSRFRVIVDR